jgi:exodeoxyribonuclease-3
MKIVTWNINGLRSGWDNLNKFIKEENPDIVCLQEIKIAKKDIGADYRNIQGYLSFFNSAEKPGYSGTAIYTKQKPLEVLYGVGDNDFDAEGRVIVAKYDQFDLVNCYFPHSSRDLKRLDFKMKFNKTIENFVKRFDQSRLVLCGDLNVAHKEIDLARPKDNKKNAGFTAEERAWMDAFLSSGLVDVYRRLYPKKIEYTWWSNFFSARERNIGWRIDYFVTGDKFLPMIEDCRIESKYFGSDHCPVILELKDERI